MIVQFHPQIVNARRSSSIHPPSAGGFIWLLVIAGIAIYVGAC